MRKLFLLSVAAIVLFAGLCASASPHILMILADDYGWANVGYHRNPPTTEIQTPNIDSLVKNGVEMDRTYSYMFCSPSRSALLSGRNPIHVNLLNLDPDFHNPKDNISGYAGVSLNMTMIPAKLKGAGYKTHFVGKWDAGMATRRHLPTSRGFDSSLGYFHHANDYWTEHTGVCDKQSMFDFWSNSGPAYNQSNHNCSETADGTTTCHYEDNVFVNQVLSIIAQHDASKPLFIYWAPHTVHAPLEVPSSYLNKFASIDKQPRRIYSAMVNHLDDMIGSVVEQLKSKGMWDNTVVAFGSDNGGPIYQNGSAGANNYPLRGGKMSNWEGGVRTNSWVSGGYLPESARGRKVEGYATLWDWYATFCALAGVDPTDTAAIPAGLPPIDSFNLWPMIVGQNSTSPRTEIPLGAPALGLQGLISGEYKLLLGPVAENGWQGPFYPNISTNWDSGLSIEICGTAGCLFNIIEDPTEHNEISAKFPEVVASLKTRMAAIEKTVFKPDRGTVDPQACQAALNTYKGYWGPWLP